MDTKFRHSIRFKIAVIVFVTTLFTIFISWYLSNHFIEQFYVTHSKNMLVQTYESCDNFFSQKENSKNLGHGNSEKTDLSGKTGQPPYR